MQDDQESYIFQCEDSYHFTELSHNPASHLREAFAYLRPELPEVTAPHKPVF